MVISLHYTTQVTGILQISAHLSTHIRIAGAIVILYSLQIDHLCTTENIYTDPKWQWKQQ